MTALGHRNGRFLYFSPSGKLHQLSAAEHKDLGLIALFNGYTQWLRQNFSSDNGTSWRNLATWLMQQCASKGLFDETIEQRGPGVWRSQDDSLVIHAGDSILIHGDWQRAGFRQGDLIYPAAPAVARPADKPASAAEGRDLREAFALWNYETFGDADLGPEILMGFVGAAMLGAAPSWRVHLLVPGRLGTGKSSLSELVASVLGGGAFTTNNTTEAGLRQLLTGQARTIIFDEAEADASATEGIQKVIGLIRRMSGGKGAHTLRGSAGGASRGAKALRIAGAAHGHAARRSLRLAECGGG